MSSYRPYGRRPSSHFDDEDDGEPFEQDPPTHLRKPAAGLRPASPSASALPRPPGMASAAQPERPGNERPGSERPGNERPGSEMPGNSLPAVAAAEPAGGRVPNAAASVTPSASLASAPRISAASSDSAEAVYSRSSERRGGHRAVSEGRRPSRAEGRDGGSGFGAARSQRRTSTVAADAEGQTVRRGHDGDDETRESTYSRKAAAPRKTSTLSLKGRALSYLSRREHSRSELSRKLAPHLDPDAPEQTLESLLNSLEEQGWLSDSRFAESVVNRRAGKFGSMRIIGELKRHAIDQELVQELGASLKDSEWARIQQVWSRKFGERPLDAQTRLKQIRFLAARGFSHTLIARVLQIDRDQMPSDDE